MKPHAIIAQGPVIARSRITLGHDTIDTKRFETCCESDSAAQCQLCQDCCLYITYAFPPPIIKTSVSNVAMPSNCLPGDLSNASSSCCTSKPSRNVLRTQIFHSIVSLRLLTGSRTTFPLHVAPGEAVRKEIPQSMNCCRHGQWLATVFRCQHYIRSGSGSQASAQPGGRSRPHRQQFPLQFPSGSLFLANSR